MKISQRGWKTGIVINIAVVISLDFIHDGGKTQNGQISLEDDSSWATSESHLQISI